MYQIIFITYDDRNLESRGFIPVELEDSLGALFTNHVRALISALMRCKRAYRDSFGSLPVTFRMVSSVILKFF